MPDSDIQASGLAFLAQLTDSIACLDANAFSLRVIRDELVRLLIEEGVPTRLLSETACVSVQRINQIRAGRVIRSDT